MNDQSYWNDPRYAAAYQEDLPYIPSEASWSSGPPTGNFPFAEEDYLPPSTSSGLLPQGKGPQGSSSVDLHHATGKHRRSRRGCFTCRTRRVKCDENRPVCVRCQKASRDCTFPDEQISLKSKPEPLTKRESSQDANLLSLKDSREDVQTPSLTHSKSSKSLSPAVQSASLSPQNIREQLAAKNPTSSILFFFDYYQEHLELDHYGFNYDGCGFLKVYLPLQAVQFEPLLYALIGFAAYHYTVNQKSGEVKNFLVYYSKSMSLLRTYLQEHPNLSDPIPALLTILQLAQLEEFFGDWNYVISHSKAALTLLKKAFTANTVAENLHTVKLLEWCHQFDVKSSYMSGQQTAMDRDWFVNGLRYYEQLRDENPEDTDRQYEVRNMQLRLFAMDLSGLQTKQKLRLFSSEELLNELYELDAKFAAWYQNFQPKDLDLMRLLRDDSSKKSLEGVEEAKFWLHCVFLQKLWGVQILIKNVIFLMLNQDKEFFVREVVPIARRVCSMFEIVQRHCPTPGALFGAHGSLAIASLQLSNDPKHTLWYREKLAVMESNGYVFPMAMRKRMSSVVHEDVTHWWLPNEELLTPIIRTIRDFVGDRSHALPDPSRSTDDDLRNMNGIFETLSLGDT